ncbi:MAG: serine hydroxymethyltransferase [Leptospiraceae bacterium]|nr:serine hydroxymethyltransferase [Leptospiraceae bacterium]MDW8306559.1 serine hydroxymethyltransferase [Leptospiraceae bacterium]
MPYELLKESDPEVYFALKREDERQENHLELIASENFVSQAVLTAYTSTLTNKYAEGYPGKRYYGGCGPADEIENLARERLKKIFKANYANVQPHSGAQANMAVFLATMQPGDTFLGMDLSHGGHLSHGMNLNFSGLFFKPVFYGVNPETELLDYDKIYELAEKHRPKLIIAGASAYPRIIDFAKFHEIAKSVGAKLLVDMAHIAGLVATGLHPSPVGLADYITSTTHKTLRGPRGGFILTQTEENAKLIDQRVFPGVQGGPLMHVIAAKAVAFGEALQSEFLSYQKQVVQNAQVLAQTLKSRGFRLVTGGTDNHLILVNTFDTHHLTGKQAQEILEEVGITTNKNTLPFDKNKPAHGSGIRLGTPALTTRGLRESEMEKIGHLIADTLENHQDEKRKQHVAEEVKKLCKAFPMDRFRLP